MTRLVARICLFLVTRASSLTLQGAGEQSGDGHAPADADVLVLNFDTKGHMKRTVFGGFEEPGGFHGLQYSFGYQVVEFRGLSAVTKAFGHIEKVKPRLALWLLPFFNGDGHGMLANFSSGHRAARSQSSGTRHGVFYWPPERCDRIPPNTVEDAFGDVDFVFQFGYQDGRLAAKDPQKYLPWPLGTAGWRSWRTPPAGSVAPLGGRATFASFRGTRSTRSGASQLEKLGQVPGVVIEFRDKWAQNDSQAEADRYKELLATSQYALSPPGHNPNCYRIQEAVESGAIPVILPGTNLQHNTTACYNNWSGLYGLPVGDATAYPWIPTAPFRTLKTFGDLVGSAEGMRTGATDATGRQLQSWYKHWRRAFHDQLEQRVKSSLALSALARE
mmetsp:Transcript_93632/g.243859  ORF Transcript_93632/g.243859 Transcript_93632/m.243859 type:complete len:388 (+) Transcript_93632:31-1194(+)